MEDAWKMHLQKQANKSYCGALKKVQDEGDDTAVYANEEVDT